MRIEPFNRQLELIAAVLDPNVTVVVYGGGIRGGKTFAALLAMFLYLRKYPGSKATIVRDSIPTLFRNTVPSFNKITPTRLIENEQQLRANIPYRQSQINFFAENYDADKELDRWKGLETNLFLLEEFPELNEKSFWKAIERAGSWIISPTAKNPNPVQPPPKIIATCNPSNGYVKELVYDKWKKGALPKGWVYIPALAFDNPHLPAAYLENLKNLPEKQYNVFVKGIWEDLKLEDLFAEEFNRDIHVKPCQWKPELPTILSFDFNIANTCTVIQKQERGVNMPKITVPKSYKLRGGIEALCTQIKKDFPGARFLFTGDASGNAQSGLTAGNLGYWQQIMAAFGYNRANPRVFRVPKANPSHKGSYLHCGVVFKHYEIEIDPSNEGLINDFERVQIISKIVSGATKMEIDKSDLEMGHFLDNWRYFVNAFCPEALKYIPDSLKQ